MFKFIFEGAKDNFDEKLKSPFWGSMIVTWLTWNWEVWYTTIFVSESLTGNKVIYIKKMYNYFDFYNLFPCVGIIFHWIIMPLLLSWCIIIFITPKISLWFKEKHRDNQIEENKIKIEEIESETDVLNAEEKIKIKELEYLTQQEEMKKTIENLKKDAEFASQNNKTIEEKWDQEYENMIKNHPHLFNELTTFIYNHHGYFKIEYKLGGTWKHGYAGEQVIPILHAFELIIMDKSIDAKYLLTEKGKYFLKKFSLHETKKENS